MSRSIPDTVRNSLSLSVFGEPAFMQYAPDAHFGIFRKKVVIIVTKIFQASSTLTNPEAKRKFRMEEGPVQIKGDNHRYHLEVLMSPEKKYYEERQNQERRRSAKFSTRFSLPEYRSREAELHRVWKEQVEQFFPELAKVLVEPHISFYRPAPRSLGHCHPVTGSGAKLDIVIAPGLAFGTRKDWVVHRWPGDKDHPALGTQRMIHDLMLRFLVRQVVLEVDGVDEKGYDGYGSIFADRANTASIELDPEYITTTKVVAKNRGTETHPLAKFWPHCIRKPSYYGGDIHPKLLDVAAGRLTAASPSAVSPSPEFLELQLYLLANGRVKACQIGR